MRKKERKTVTTKLFAAGVLFFYSFPPPTDVKLFAGTNKNCLGIKWWKRSERRRPVVDQLGLLQLVHQLGDVIPGCHHLHRGVVLVHRGHLKFDRRKKPTKKQILTSD